MTRSESSKHGESRTAPAGSLASAEARDRLIFEVDRWLGIDYRYGGSGRSGFDCSGFVRRVFRDAFDAELPRTTRDQMKAGQDVRRSDLQMADLVFFRTSSRSGHVGIYLGDGEFVHASTSSGVMISHLGERYWADSYRTARRVLEIEPLREPTAMREVATRSEEEPDPTEATGSVARVGW